MSTQRKSTRLLLALLLVCATGYAADNDGDGLPDDWEAQYGFSTNGLPNTSLTPSALVGWWQMDDTSQTNVLDRSINNLTGTPDNFAEFPFVTGLYGNALSFTTNSFVHFDPTNAVLSITNSFTISLWFHGTNATDETTLVEWNGLNTNTWELSVATNGVAQFRFADALGTVQTVTAGTNGWNVRDAAWHQIAGVFNHASTNASLYVDGEAEASGAITNWTPGSALGSSRSRRPMRPSRLMRSGCTMSGSLPTISLNCPTLTRTLTLMG